jgi:hypothetical protein
MIGGRSLVAGRRYIADVIAAFSRRVTKINIGDIGIELSPMPKLEPKWSFQDFDVRKLTSSQAFDSYSQSLFDQLRLPTPADYAIIDLGEGKEWLTSRLYIFALVLGRVSRLKAFVFVETKDRVTRNFIGTANPESIRLCLAKKYPWLEAAFVKAYASQAPNPKKDLVPFELSELGKTESWKIMTLVQNYIEEIQSKTAPGSKNKKDWISFGKPKPTWERTCWIDSELIDELLGSELIRLSYTDSPDQDPSTKTEAILKRPSDFVALIDEKGRFSHLIDRASMVEEAMLKIIWQK